MKKHSLHDDIGYWIGRFQAEVAKKFEQSLLQEDITIAQWCILVSIFNNDAQTITELSQFIGVDKGSISRVLEKLYQRGLVERLPGLDRRSERLSLTDVGKNLTEKLSKLAEKNDSYFFDILTNQEKQALKAILNKLVTHAGISPIGGWITDQINKINTGEAMKEKVIEILEAGKSNGTVSIVSFVEYVKNLKAAGIKNFIINLNSHITKFYDMNDTVVFEKVENFKHRAINSNFDEDALKKASEVHVNKKTPYESFIYDAQDAGVDHYIVDLINQETRYYNKDESQCYVRKFAP